MKNQSQPLGLVIEGNSTHSAVLRLSVLAEGLGPVKSVAKRVARRLSNLLHIGYAVDTYEELQDARIILLRVPDASLPRVVDELCTSALKIQDLMFVLCESWLSSDALQALCDRGAQVATVMSAPSSQDKCFLVEGQQPVVRQVKRFIERSDARTLEIRAGTKHFYFGAKVLATALPLPFLADAQAILRASGITGRQLYSLLEEMHREMFRAFLNGARLTWGGPLTECSPEIAESHLRRLEASHPKLADDLKEQLEWARRKSHGQRRSAGRQE